MRRMLYLFCAVLACGPSLHAANYTKEIQKCVQNAIGKDFGRYQYLSAPIDHFGAGTMYPKAAKGAQFDIKTMGIYGDPQTWWTVKDPAQIAADLALLTPSGDSGGVAATCDTSAKFDLSAVLPSLFKLLTLNAGVNYNKTVKVQISFSAVEFHTLNWSVLGEDDKKKLIDEDVSAHLGAHDFLITVGDVVLHEYTAQLTLDKSLSATAKAQLTSAWKSFAKDSALTADFSSGDDGTFKLTAKNPVVAAVFVGEPPAGVVLEASPKTFTQVTLAPSVLDVLSSTKPKDLGNSKQ